MFTAIQTYIQQRIEEDYLILPDRKAHLLKLAAYFSEKYQKGETPKGIVICTHNSRRSHLGQVWLAAGAAYFDLPPLEAYSGGTEATAFNPRAVAALKRVGFDIGTATPNDTNPIYQVKWSEGEQYIEAFSKKYDSPPNPSTVFAAIMVCTDADEKCPIVQGTDFRFSLPFDDPKAFDDTSLEGEKYDERCRQISREFLFVLKNVQQ